MRVLTPTAIESFCAKHADARKAMEEWHAKTKAADWRCFADIKRTFNSTDAIGERRYVFNIKGTNYRIVAVIGFEKKKVYIRFIGTHDQYNRINCLKI
jgi:mRNA interferase HigB